MITMPIVKQCPHTTTGIGVMHIAHGVLATLAEAVYEQDEWIALLVGTRSTNGLDIHVESLRVPLQERCHSTCELSRPEPLTPDVVGVIHSHHNMGAFFSQTDINTLNTRFPSSLVVAQNKVGSSEVERLLGFNYKAEGRGVLPCGSIGIIDFHVMPFPPILEWPIVKENGFTEPDTRTSLYYCPFTTKTQEGLVQHCQTACGIIIMEPATRLFGYNGKEFLNEVREKTQRTKYGRIQIKDTRRDFFGKKQKRFRDIEDYDQWNNEEGGYLTHWGV